MTAKKTYSKPDTILAVAGRDPDNNFGIVNPPVYHASTILSPTMEKFENRIPFEGFGYGRNGTPTQKALEDAVAAIEGAHRSIAVQSGLAAVTSMWSPVLRKPTIAPVTAPSPDCTAIERWAPSMAATASSSAFCVGVPLRP